MLACPAGGHGRKGSLLSAGGQGEGTGRAQASPVQPRAHLELGADAGRLLLLVQVQQGLGGAVVQCHADDQLQRLAVQQVLRQTSGFWPAAHSAWPGRACPQGPRTQDRWRLRPHTPPTPPAPAGTGTAALVPAPATSPPRGRGWTKATVLPPAPPPEEHARPICTPRGASASRLCASGPAALTLNPSIPQLGTS